MQPRLETPRPKGYMRSGIPLRDTFGYRRKTFIPVALGARERASGGDWAIVTN